MDAVKNKKMICGCGKNCARYALRTTDTRGSHITHQNQPINHPTKRKSRQTRKRQEKELLLSKRGIKI
jgi:hypothetical protein